MEYPKLGAIYKDKVGNYLMVTSTHKAQRIIGVENTQGNTSGLDENAFSKLKQVWPNNQNLDRKDSQAVLMKLACPNLVNSPKPLKGDTPNPQGSRPTPKVLILGHARHGKDTVAEMLGVNYRSSSQEALDIFLFEELQDYMTRRELGKYVDRHHAFEDRIHERVFWHEAIKAYNKDDPARLAKGIMERNDCYVGMRSKVEFQACLEQGLFDKIFWVDAAQRKPLESPDSFDIEFDPTTMVYLSNNGTEEDLAKTIALHT